MEVLDHRSHKSLHLELCQERQISTDQIDTFLFDLRKKKDTSFELLNIDHVLFRNPTICIECDLPTSQCRIEISNVSLIESRPI